MENKTMSNVNTTNTLGTVTINTENFFDGFEMEVNGEHLNQDDSIDNLVCLIEQKFNSIDINVNNGSGLNNIDIDTDEETKRQIENYLTYLGNHSEEWLVYE